MKTMSIFLGIVLLVVALVCFSSDSLNGAVIGTIALMGALFAIKYGDQPSRAKGQESRGVDH